MGEALGSRGPPLRHQVQHGQQEGAEVVRLLFGPLVLLNQHVEQTPRLQLGDVTQVTWDAKWFLLHITSHSFRTCKIMALHYNFNQFSAFTATL